MRVIIRVLITILVLLLIPVQHVDTGYERLSHVINSKPIYIPIKIHYVDYYSDLEVIDTRLPYSSEDIDLLAIVTMAESEGEPEYGKRLVIDTILNRVDSTEFPDSIYDVVYQPNHFSSMSNGRVDRCYVMSDIRQLVIEELVNRTDYNVLYFNAYNYSRYGVPYKQVGGHYFSK